MDCACQVRCRACPNLQITNQDDGGIFFNCTCNGSCHIRSQLYPCSSHKPIDPIVNFVRPTGDAPGPSNGVDEPSREVDESSNKSNKSNDASVETSDRSTSPKGKSSKPTEQSDGSDESSDSSDASSGEPDDPNNGSSASDNEKDGSPCSKKSASGNSKVSRTLIASRHRANTNRNTYPTPGPSRYASRRQNSQALAAGADYEDDNL